MTLEFKKIVLVSFLLCLSLINTSTASELTHKFGNPSFSKEGYSQHVLSVEQLQYTRENDRVKDAKSALSQAERDEKNKTINKFIANVESRIYANLSKQLVDNMFGTGCDTTDVSANCQNSGTATIDPDGDGTGATLAWIRDESAGTITLTVTAEDGTITNLTVPVGNFLF